MARLVVAISKVEDGNMRLLGDVTSEAIISNSRVWLQGLGMNFDNTTRLRVTYDQADFCRYRTLTNQNKSEGMPADDSAPSDAFVVTETGHAVFLPIADCVATVFYDEAHSVFMLSHLGRHSLEQRGGVRSVDYLVEHFGVNPATLKVWLAPAPSKESYSIYALNNQGMKEALYEQLEEAGVSAEHISDANSDTVTDPDYYSHTAFLKGTKPVDGRFAMVAMMVEDSSK